MRYTSKFFLVACTFFLFVATSAAQNKLLTIDDLYDPVKRVNFSGQFQVELKWLPDGKSYLQRKRDSQGRKQLLKVNALTGEAAPFFDVAKMETAFAKLPGLSADDVKSIADNTMEMNGARTAALINFANDLFYYEFGRDQAIRLTNTPEEEVGEEFSPDGRLVAFVRNYNLYVVDTVMRRERALTLDGSSKLFNGRLDWVYQEELYGRGDFKAFWWSPDSSKIAYLQLDESPVKEFIVVDHIPLQQNIESIAYPKAGAPNPGVRVGVVNAVGGPTQWLDMYRYRSAEPLVVRVSWKLDSSRVVFAVQNREQTWLDLNFADPSTGKVETAFREISSAWIEPENHQIIKWLQDGSFIWSSERSGWKHLYHYSTDYKLIRPITTGKWEVREVEGINETNGWIYFSGTERSHIGSDAYRIKLDGTGLQRLTEAPGTHQVNFDPTLSYFIDVWSDAQTPPQVRLYSADGKLARVIEENRVDALKQYKLGKVEFLQVKARDGFLMEALMIKPPDFDPRKKYPVWSQTYGGPHAPWARNAWGRDTMWYQMLAQKGYIVWICDNRSASGKGAESTWTVYKQLGVGELQDLEDGVAYLKSLPYVDSSRIGVGGWSFGGFMTAYALTHSTAFKVGISGAPVTDWRLYDSIYTERYMGMPQNNPEGYDKTSVIKAAKNLNGKLLIIHGTIDDNVHLQNSMQFVYELQRAGKQFELMVYPKSRHGFNDPVLIKHMRELMLKFILENL